LVVSRQRYLTLITANFLGHPVQKEFLISVQRKLAQKSSNCTTIHGEAKNITNMLQRNEITVKLYLIQQKRSLQYTMSILQYNPLNILL